MNRETMRELSMWLYELSMSIDLNYDPCHDWDEEDQAMLDEATYLMALSTHVAVEYVNTGFND